ncbi:hypothetical protein FB451DRAFT_1164279 [Mycena latifolia]|nr:hypothetical protein FB451DRAFT_1164279 [Mycena latifolia]
MQGAMQAPAGSRTPSSSWATRHRARILMCVPYTTDAQMYLGDEMCISSLPRESQRIIGYARRWPYASEEGRLNFRRVLLTPPMDRKASKLGMKPAAEDRDLEISAVLMDDSSRGQFAEGGGRGTDFELAAGKKKTFRTCTGGELNLELVIKPQMLSLRYAGFDIFRWSTRGRGEMSRLGWRLFRAKERLNKGKESARLESKSRIQDKDLTRVPYTIDAQSSLYGAQYSGKRRVAIQQASTGTRTPGSSWATGHISRWNIDVCTLPTDAHRSWDAAHLKCFIGSVESANARKDFAGAVQKDWRLSWEMREVRELVKKTDPSSICTDGDSNPELVIATLPTRPKILTWKGMVTNAVGIDGESNPELIRLQAGDKMCNSKPSERTTGQVSDRAMIRRAGKVIALFRRRGAMESDRAERIDSWAAKSNTKVQGIGGDSNPELVASD